MAPPPAPKRRRIGFVVDTDDAAKDQISGPAKRKRAAKGGGERKKLGHG